MKGVITCMLIVLYLNTVNAADMYDDMTRLLNDEFENYDKDVIPKRRTTDSHVTVKIYPRIYRIENLDEDLGEISTRIYLTMSWVDDRLAWDRRTYNGIREAHVPASKIWVPDIAASNSVYAADEHNHPATFSYQGRVNLTRIIHARTPCNMDYTTFPNDQHTCEIDLSSWKYPGQYLMLEMWNDVTDIPVSMETDSSEWRVRGTARGKLEIVSYDCCPNDDFPQLNITFTVSRNSNILRHMFLVPLVLVSALVPLQFLVPNQRENRHLFGILLIIIGVISFIHVCLYIPSTSSLPFIGKMHIVSISFAALSLLLSTLASNIGCKYSSLKSVINKCNSKNCVKQNGYAEEMVNLNAENTDKRLDIVRREIQEVKNYFDKSMNKNPKLANTCDIIFFLFFVVTFIAETIILFLGI